MPNPLDKVINLIKRTGDNFIILDQEGEPQYVVMSFVKYQAMVTSDKNLAGLTQNQLLEKINEDVATWRQENIENSNAKLDKVTNTFPQKENINWAPSEENSLNKAEKISDDNSGGEKYYFEPID